MKICIAGKNNIAVNVCKHIRTHYHDIELLIILNKTDKGVNSFQFSLKKYAELKKLKICQLEDVYDIEDLIFLSLEFDRLIIPTKFKSKRLFNIHFSLLPSYKGMYTSALPIINGEKITGVTFHYIDNGIDTGNIIDQESFSISREETAKSLYLKYISYGTDIVIKNIDKLLKGNYSSVPQPKDHSTYYSKLSIDYSNLQISLNDTAYTIDCKIRAFSFRDYQLPIVHGYPIFYTEITNEKSLCKSGEILEDNKEYIKISTIDYNLILYKDNFLSILDIVKNNDIEGLKKFENIERYIEEREVIHGWTLLMVAAYNNSFECVKYLIDKGANVNATSNNGTSVIMYAKDGAINTHNSDSFSYLLGQQANPYMKDFYEKNLFDYLDIKDIMLQYIDNKMISLGGGN